MSRRRESNDRKQVSRSSLRGRSRFSGTNAPEPHQNTRKEVVGINTLAEKHQQQAGTEPNCVHGVARLWKLERAAEILDMPLSTAYEHSRSKLFDSFIIRIGRQVRVHPEKFQEWLESGGAALAGGWRKESNNG